MCYFLGRHLAREGTCEVIFFFLSGCFGLWLLHVFYQCIYFTVISKARKSSEESHTSLCKMCIFLLLLFNRATLKNTDVIIFTVSIQQVGNSHS